MKVCALLIALLALLAVPAAAAAPASSSSCRSRLTKLQRQNRALQQKVRKLTAQRDDARGKLAVAQQGVSSALTTMSGQQIWPLFTQIAGVYVTPRWSNSHFTSGPDYES